MIFIRVMLLLAGFLLVFATLLSAIKTFVLPRSAADPITRTLFRVVRRLFDWRLCWAHDYLEKDRVMALFAPTALLLLVPCWLTLVAIGFTAIYWASGIESPMESFDLSGSSLLTLGFARGPTLLHDLLTFAEAIIGLILVALLISYLPTMYSAFSRREVAVTQLSVRAGTPPSAVEFILRAHRIGALHNLRDFWAQWETWFAEVEESHTSLAALVFFRSPDPSHSWVTAAGAVMDAAALLAAVVDVERQPQAELCIRAGYLALRRIGQFFNIKFHATPRYPEQTDRKSVV